MCFCGSYSKLLLYGFLFITELCILQHIRTSYTDFVQAHGTHQALCPVCMKETIESAFLFLCGSVSQPLLCCNSVAVLPASTFLWNRSFLLLSNRRSFRQRTCMVFCAEILPRYRYYNHTSIPNDADSGPCDEAMSLNTQVLLSLLQLDFCFLGNTLRLAQTQQG